MPETKSVFTDALRQSERRTWELWDAVRTGAGEIAQAARAKKVTGVAVDVKKKVAELVSDYSVELVPAIVDQIEQYVEDNPDEPFYLKAATLEKILMIAKARADVHVPVDSANGTVAYQGGTVKALGGGKVGGYLVLFSSAEDPDLQGEYFTKSTDLFIDSGDQRPILYRHGVHPVIKSRKLGKARLTVDEIGVFVDGELELRDKYEKAIYSLAEQGKLGWSSGSMSHLVSKNKNGKSFEITAWPIGEASLTPAPVEGRTSAIAVKDIVIDADELNFDQFVKSVDQDHYDQHFSIDGIPSIKAFCEAVAPNSLKNGSQRSESAANAAKEFITITKLMGEAFHSYTSRLVRRSEHRFLKEGREIDASTVAQVESTLSDMERIQRAFDSIKEVLSGIKKVSEMTTAEQRALDERARLATWEFCLISGTTPEELST